MAVCEVCGKEKEGDGKCQHCLAMRRSMTGKQQEIEAQQIKEKERKINVDSGLKPITQEIDKGKSPLDPMVIIGIAAVVLGGIAFVFLT